MKLPRLTKFGSLQSAARSNAHALLFFFSLFFSLSFQIGLTDVQLASLLNKRAAIHQERKNLAHCESMIRELRVAAGSHLRSLHHTMDDIQSQRTHQLTRCAHGLCGLDAMAERIMWAGCFGTLTHADTVALPLLLLLFRRDDPDSARQILYVGREQRMDHANAQLVHVHLKQCKSTTTTLREDKNKQRRPHAAFSLSLAHCSFSFLLLLFLHTSLAPFSIVCTHHCSRIRKQNIYQPHFANL